jgi:DNA-binding phage protein
MRILERKDIVQLLRTEVEKAGSQTAWATKNGIDRGDVNRVLHGAMQPTGSIIRALGLRKAAVSLSRSRTLKGLDIRRMLRADVAAAESQAAWAKKNGVHRSTVYKVLRSAIPPTKRIIHALRLRIVAVSDRD